jgi:hypothetical protein
VPDIKAQIENSIAKKRLVHDQDAGKKCLAALKDVACDDLLSLFSEGKGDCDLSFVGLVDVEGDCYQGNECKPGHFCELVGDCIGACRKYVKVGGACGAGTACEPDSQCIGGLCRERAAEGEVCGGDIRIGCKSGLLCLPNSPTTGTCTKGLKEGECTTSAVCAIGYQCAAANDTATSGACTPVKREGESCTDGLNQCVFSTSCLQGVCTLWGGEGTACGVVGKEHDVRCFQSWCGAENEADANAGIGACRALIEDGGQCGDDSQCVNGYCDFFAGGICVSACAPQ